MFVLVPPYKSLQFPTFLRVHPSSSALGSRSQTREAVAGNVDSWKGRLYARNGCHYFNSWSVHRWSVSKSWLVLMCRLNIVVFGIFATFAVSFRLVLSVEHEPEIAGPTAPATASTRHWQPEWFPLLWIKTVFFFLNSDNRTTADSQKCCTTIQFTDLVSNRF